MTQPNVRPAVGRHNSWLFADSDRGADRCAFMLSLIAMAKLNDVVPQASLADVLARIADMLPSRLEELLHWNWGNRAEPSRSDRPPPDGRIQSVTA